MNSENARSRMGAISAEKHEKGGKGRWVKYWARVFKLTNLISLIF
jgi:hypothetical protein